MKDLKDKDRQEKAPAGPIGEGQKRKSSTNEPYIESITQDDGYWKSLVGDEPVAGQAQTVETDWETLLGAAITDPSILFTADLIERAATAYRDPQEWSKLNQWIAAHKLLGFDKRRWQKEIRKTAANLTVIHGRKGGKPSMTATPVVGTVWPTAPTPTLPLVPGWCYEPEGIGLETDQGVAVVSDPAYVQEWLKDVNDSTVNLTVCHRVSGQWEPLVIPASTLLKADKVSLLADQGLGIADPRGLARFLNQHYQMMRQIIPAIHGTKLSGVQTIGGCRVAVFPDAIWHPTGQSGNSVRLTDTAGVTFIKARPRVGTDAVAKEVLDHVAQVGQPRKIKILAGWMAATGWADQIRETFERRYPIANIFAIHESGKTTVLKRLLAAIVGGDEIGTARDTRFRLTRQMAAATTIPLILDEFRLNEISPTQTASLYDLCRRNYDGGTDGRGQADQTIRAYQLVAPTLISGESRITDTALMDRIVAVSLNPEDARSWYGGTTHLRWLEDHSEESRQCAGYLLQKRLNSPMTNAQLRQNIQDLENALRALPESHGWPERALWGLAVVWFGLKWLESLGLIGKLTHDDWEATLTEGQQARRQAGPVDRFVHFLEEVAGAGGKWRTQTVPLSVTEITGELRVGVTAANTGFALWAKDLGLPNLGQENLEDELGRSGLMTNDEPLKATRKLGPPINAAVHAYSINIYRVEERYGIPKSYWGEILRPRPTMDE